MSVDATLVKSHYSVNAPEGRKDTDAVWTVKQDKPHYGYKAHISVDNKRMLKLVPA